MLQRFVDRNLLLSTAPGVLPVAAASDLSQLQVSVCGTASPARGTSAQPAAGQEPRAPRPAAATSAVGGRFHLTLPGNRPSSLNPRFSERSVTFGARSE